METEKAESRYEITTYSAGINTPVRVEIRDIETGATATAEGSSILVARERAKKLLLGR